MILISYLVISTLIVLKLLLLYCLIYPKFKWIVKNQKREIIDVIMLHTCSDSCGFDVGQCLRQICGILHVCQVCNKRLLDKGSLSKPSDQMQDDEIQED